MDEKTKQILEDVKVWIQSWAVLFIALRKGEAGRDEALPANAHPYLVAVFEGAVSVKPIFDAVEPAAQAVIVAALMKWIKNIFGQK
jgi:hypothetical protein